ncbi:homeobox domain-containing protein [Lactarius indigo]|nr:homeobox domain-containing protein [Lactarius indigo]
MALSRHPSLSPTPSYDLQISNSRKRPSVAQIQRLQTIFDSSRYISKEERSALAHEIGLDVKFITVWFQNRRQSDKRKAWTKRDRARKKENTCHRIHIHTVFSKPVVSLDQIASRSERVQSTCTPRPTSCRVLNSETRELLGACDADTVKAGGTLGTHAIITPRCAFLSAPVDDGSPSCPIRKVPRVGLCQRKDRKQASTQAGQGNPSKSDSDSDQDSEVPTPAQSQATDDCNTPKYRPDELRGKSTKDVEAAMALLQFLRG